MPARTCRNFFDRNYLLPDLRMRSIGVGGTPDFSAMTRSCSSRAARAGASPSRPQEAVRAALGDGRLKGNEALPAKVTLTVGGIDLSVEIEGAVELE